MCILEISGDQYRLLGLIVSCLVADVPYFNLLSCGKGPKRLQTFKMCFVTMETNFEL